MRSRDFGVGSDDDQVLFWAIVKRCENVADARCGASSTDQKERHIGAQRLWSEFLNSDVCTLPQLIQRLQSDRRIGRCPTKPAHRRDSFLQVYFSADPLLKTVLQILDSS